MQKRVFLLSIAALAISVGLLNAQAPQPDPKDPQYQAKGDQKRTYAFPEQERASHTICMFR